jgi:hypothetical protein
VVTVTAMQVAPSEGIDVTGLDVTKPREAFAPAQVPFSEALLQPFNNVIHDPPGVAVTVGVPVRV